MEQGTEVKRSQDIHLRRMTAADIAFGLQLSMATGWNQTAADWRLILRQRGARGFVASLDGTAAGTVTALPYQKRFSWLGMALVSAQFQRRGIGTALLKAAIEAVEQQGALRLDATPAGIKLYDSLGFHKEYALARLLRPAQALRVNPEAACRPVAPGLFTAIGRFDIPVFGADRLAILKGLFRMAPQLAFARVTSGEVRGYCLGRVGARYAQVGPVIAENAEIARDLVLCALSRCAARDVIVDVPLWDAGWLAWLSELGFTHLRPFTRMRRGEADYSEQPQRQFAIAGPEIG